VRQTVNKLQGAFAIAVICADYPDELIIARQQAPNDWFWSGEFLSPIPPALVPHTRAVLTLENGELARLTPLGVEVVILRAIASKNPALSVGIRFWLRSRDLDTSWSRKSMSNQESCGLV